MAVASLTRLLDTRRMKRRLRWYWERTRPFALPHYLPGTPRTNNAGPLDIYLPPTALTLGDAALSTEAASCVAAIFDKLTSCEELAVKQLFYRWAQAKFGEHWRYADLFTTLWAAAGYLKPASYLEIGVRRGWSAAIVGARAPDCTVYGFDLWPPSFHGVANPGPDFVRAELQAAGHSGVVTLVPGNSHDTVPSFLDQRADLYFDLITVDGDKSVGGVASDLATVLPRLKVGGVVVFDDLPLVPSLRRVWNKVIERDGRYANWEFHDGGSGVAAAIRIADEAPLPQLPRSLA